ncbi:hypothetical protein CKALI_03035 [Corynebacterium kalinowskii]|uniref:Secreted protein n=1 Tax=Corynebacterium kalinowskii TaxID=2675216 RepID=A0A6B8VW06_9CORY|nr:hypothetical protein [Corynebacterium kalinowskii]QGU01490.1 hypothetical protein CKALI_03035 [Corynebacterium kalinowskii]
MKSFSKLVVAVGVATSLTLGSTPAFAQESGSSQEPAMIGSSVAIGLAGLGAAAATFGPNPVLDVNKLQQGFTQPQLAPYAVAFTAGLIALAGVIGTLIGNAVG